MPEADSLERVLLALVPAGGALVAGGASIVLAMGAASAKLDALARTALVLLAIAMGTGLAVLFVAMGSLPWALPGVLSGIGVLVSVAGQGLGDRHGTAYSPAFDRAMRVVTFLAFGLTTAVSFCLHGSR